MEILNSQGRALCTCVCWGCALCVSAPCKGFGLLAPEQRGILTPQPLSSAGQLNTMGCFIFEMAITEGNHTDKVI